MKLPTMEEIELKWIPWEGGRCPLEKGTLVEVMLRSGSIYLGRALITLPEITDVFIQRSWTHGIPNQSLTHGGDIVKYRLV